MTDPSRLTPEERALLKAARANMNGTLALPSNEVYALLDRIDCLRGEVERLLQESVAALRYPTEADLEYQRANEWRLRAERAEASSDGSGRA